MWSVVWRANLQMLVHVQNGREEPVAKTRALSGNISGVAREPNGAFWLTTFQGIARWSPTIWQTPLAVPHNDTVVHSIHEDSEGRIWFASQGGLIRLRGEEWAFYPFPPGTRAGYVHTDALGSLPDGNILIRTDSKSELLAFNPATEDFQRIR